eukprot:TRINITY_DN24851_c0_g1_i2.p1 TRINITY_DN24851_c0_g1~~TRINITY_DN24851_c0_g1_i2.p1  ORF type:complete len:217 (-),score=32.38 TRINITY_DN24851_c0_g1_i2:154-804(-)
MTAPGPPRVIRRVLPGMRAAELFDWEDVAFEDLPPDSPVRLQEYLQALLRRDPADIDALLKAPEGLEAQWQYEHMRLIILQLNHFVVKLSPVCTQQTCPKMKATDEWLFLCACHKAPQECSAMDYSLHTMDGAATVLNSQRYFSARNAVPPPRETFQLFANMLRRLYRIFAHAYYHHRREFDEFEAQTFLCERFVKFGLAHKLITKKMLIIPVGAS